MIRICMPMIAIFSCVSDCIASNLREYEVIEKTFREKCLVKEGEIVLYDWEFVDRTSIYELILPDSLRVIGMHACQGISITKIKLPEGLRVMKDHCFEGCSHLSEINIPSTIEEIGCRAFAGTKIKSLLIPKEIKKIGGFWINLDQSLKLPDKSKRILNNFFILLLYKERKINSLVIPFAIIKVGRGGLAPFANYLENIIFENPATEMEKDCLRECNRLEAIGILEHTSYVTSSWEDEVRFETIMTRWNDMHKEQWRNKVSEAGADITTYSGMPFACFSISYPGWRNDYWKRPKVRIIPTILVMYEFQLKERRYYVHPSLYKMYTYFICQKLSKAEEYYNNVLKILKPKDR